MSLYKYIIKAMIEKFFKFFYILSRTKNEKIERSEQVMASLNMSNEDKKQLHLVIMLIIFSFLYSLLPQTVLSRISFLSSFIDREEWATLICGTFHVLRNILYFTVLVN